MNKDLLNLKEMWAKAEARFKSRTALSLRLNPMTWKQCIEEIERMQHADKSLTPDDGFEKAKEWGITMVHCLRLVGGVAAKAASPVFGPSEMCFNALGVLLDIPVQIRSFHKAVAMMFEELGPALSMFKIYEDMRSFDKVHPEVYRAVHDIMINFVDICSLYRKIVGNPSTMKRFWTDIMAAVLSKDSGVSDEIKRFKTLIEIHRDVQATQTLKEALETNSLVADMLLQFTGVQHDVSILRRSDEERRLEKGHQQNLKEIKDKLGWNESASEQSESTPKKILDKIPGGTATWFKTEEQFLAWEKAKTDGETQSRPVFVIGGPEDTGKSVLMSAILRHLQNTSPTRGPVQSLVAGYFFPPPSDTKDEDRHPVRTALICIAVQLAVQDNAFAKTLSQKCKKLGIDDVVRNGTYHELWAFLGIGNPKDNTTHYIIIDGFASLSKEKEREEQMKQLFSLLGTQPSSNGTVRVAISVRSNMIRLLPDDTWKNIFVVDIVQKSTKDIRKLIKDQLEDDDPFEDEGLEERERLVSQIAVNVQGNFRMIDSVVQHVNKLADASKSMEDIEKDLKTSGGKSATLSDAIRRLETELGATEVDELQELLRWTMFGRQEYWSLDELHGALLLKLGTANKGRMEKKLAAKGKYSDIFTLYEGKKVKVKDEIRELLQRTERELEADRAPKITASFEITKGNLQSLQSFCWSLSQHVAQLTFNFDQAALTAGTRKSFRVHGIDANIAMLRSTFKLLEEEPNRRTQPLGRYAIAYLPQHLESIGDLDVLGRQEKVDIAKGLYRIFMSGAMIDKHWDITDSSTLRWYRDCGEIQRLRQCICNQSILENLGFKDREWLEEVQQAQDPNKALLRPIIQKVAKRWLRNTDHSADRAFKWIHAHWKMKPRVIAEEPQDKSITAEEIEKVAKWCTDTLGIDDEEDFIRLRRLGETFAVNHCPKEGIEAFQKAIAKHDADRKLLQELAGCYAEDGQYDLACEMMTEAKYLLEREQNPDRVNLSKVCYNLGLWYSERGNLTANIEDLNQAIKNMEEAIEVDFENHMARLHLLNTYLDNKFNENARALEFIRACLGVQGGMSQILVHMMEEADDDSMFIKLFSFTRGHTELNRLLEQLSSLPDNLSGDARERARLCSGVVSYYFCQDDPEGRNTAMELWKQCCNENWHMQCFSLITAHHFEQSRTSKETETIAMHLDGMRSMGDYMITHSGIAVSYTSAFYALNEDTNRAREAVRPCVQKAFELLSDDYDSNDDDGFWLLATAFLRCGNDLNSLSAFYCLPPYCLEDAGGDVMDWLLESSRDDEVFRIVAKNLITSAWRIDNDEVEGNQLEMVFEEIARSSAGTTREHMDLPLPRTPQSQEVVGTLERLRTACGRLRSSTNHSQWGMECDICGVDWDFEHDFFRCKYCRNRMLCQKCHDRFKEEPFASKLSYVEDLTCRKDHDWLFLPKWTKETYMASLAGRVMSGGRMENNVRVCGEVVLVSDWLSAMKSEWGWSTEDSEGKE